MDARAAPGAEPEGTIGKPVMTGLRMISNDNDNYSRTPITVAQMRLMNLPAARSV
jgi:hypothetical protein